MKRLPLCLLLIFVLVGCAPVQSLLAPAQPTTLTPLLVTPTLVPQTVEPSTVEAVITPSSSVTNTSLPQPFILQFTPVPSDTPLATLELPTLAANRTALQIWDGLPTYPADSTPNYEFRLRYDPIVWALTTDQFGFPSLGNRQITGCILSPSHPRGLALNGTVDHAIRKIGGINYDISTASVNGTLQFVSYTGGDGVIYTAFQVSFLDQSDQCLSDAEAVLAMLSSISVAQATPIATP